VTQARHVERITRNSASAVGTASFYDERWRKAGTTLDYTSLNRARFLVGSIVDLVQTWQPTILDLGCGRGWLATFLSPLGPVTGIDFSPTGIAFAKANYGADGTFLLADADSPTLGLPADERFDVVVCTEVIEHAPAPDALLAQIVGFLRPGGWCMLTTPNGLLWPRFRAEPRFQENLQPIENWLTPRQLREAMAAVGLEVKRHEGSPVYGFAYGRGARLQSPRIVALFERLRMERLFGRLVLPSAVYQYVAAQKVNE
jgi:2-polyprenyl-3-methyl-5-hydroxy-6-metoxy-1,4-benzoquinol methylase